MSDSTNAANGNGVDFCVGAGIDVRKSVKVVEGTGAAYIPWASQVELAGAPQQDVIEGAFGGEGIVTELFGGGLITVRQGGDDIHLPVLNSKSAPIPFASISARDIGDVISRTRARAATMCNGVALSMYSAEHAGNGESYLKALGVKPGMGRDELVRIRYLEDKKEVRDKVTKKITRTTLYLGWHAALAAARITDPGFKWAVVSRPVLDTKTGEVRDFPAVKSPGVGWMVGVTLTWRGVSHTEWLPIMGVQAVETKYGKKPMENQPLPEPTVQDWHRSVMRCFAKGVAMVTGYGLGAYAKELPAMIDAMEAAQDVVQTQNVCAPEGDSPEQPEQSEANGHSNEAARDALVKAVRTNLTALNVDESVFTTWLQVPSVDAAPVEALQQGLSALQNRLAEKTAH